MKTFVHGCVEDKDGIRRVTDQEAEFWSVYIVDENAITALTEWRSDHLSRADAEFSASRAV